jgi:hypothetical protein
LVNAGKDPGMRATAMAMLGLLAEWMGPAKKECHRTELSDRFRRSCRGIKPDQRNGGVLFGIPLPVMKVYG